MTAWNAERMVLRMVASGPSTSADDVPNPTPLAEGPQGAQDWTSMSMARRKVPARPTDQLLKDLAAACRRNSSQLLIEAELLLSRGHFARAIALAHSAREEAAKVNLVGDVLEGSFPWDNFSELFRDHAGKYAYLNRQVRYSDPSGSDAIVSYERQLGCVEFEQRQRALFVDLVDGQIREPNVFTRTQAEQVIAAARGELQALKTQQLLTGGSGTRSAIGGLPVLESLVKRKPKR